MRYLLPLGLLITLCFPSNAAPVHHLRSHHHVIIRPGWTSSFAAAPEVYATPRPPVQYDDTPSYNDDLVLWIDRQVQLLLENRFSELDIENLVEEHASLIADLELSTLVVGVLVTMAMLIFYKDLLATLALVRRSTRSWLLAGSLPAAS